VTQYQLSYEQWTAVTLTYGQSDPREGPYVAVTTMATDATTMAGAESASAPGDDPEAELRYAVGGALERTAGSVGAGANEPSPPLVVTQETLPADPALVCRNGIVWGARLLPADPADPHAGGVTETIVGSGDAVTVAVNHLGFLQEKAPWFSADPRLRAAAIDETLRHAMLGDAVPSEPTQDAWARSWSTRVTRRGRTGRRSIRWPRCPPARHSTTTACWPGPTGPTPPEGRAETRRGPAAAGMRGCCS
jgi:hypothetical protein